MCFTFPSLVVGDGHEVIPLASCLCLETYSSLHMKAVPPGTTSFLLFARHKCVAFFFLSIIERKESVQYWQFEWYGLWKMWNFSATSPCSYTDSTLDYCDISTNSMTDPRKVICWDAISCTLWESSSSPSWWCGVGCLVLNQSIICPSNFLFQL